MGRRVLWDSLPVLPAGGAQHRHSTEQPGQCAIWGAARANRSRREYPTAPPHAQASDGEATPRVHQPSCCPRNGSDQQPVRHCQNLPAAVLQEKAAGLVPYGGAPDWECGNPAGCGDYNVGGIRPLKNRKGWVRATHHRYPGARATVATDASGKASTVMAHSAWPRPPAASCCSARTPPDPTPTLRRLLTRTHGIASLDAPALHIGRSGATVVGLGADAHPWTWLPEAGNGRLRPARREQDANKGPAPMVRGPC